MAIVTDYRNLSVIVPAFNEEGGVQQTLEALKKNLPNAEIILVDDCSTDNTPKMAKKVDGVHILRHRFNRGYGAALKSGMVSSNREHIAWFDADGEHRTEDLQAMFKLLEERSLGAIIGRRQVKGQQKVRFYGKLVLRLWARLLGLRLDRDLNCGLRVFHKEAILPYLNMLPDRFSASTTSTMIMLEKKYPIEFFDIRTNPRIGHSKVRLRHGFETILNIFRISMIFAPLRIYGTLGAVLVVIGFVYGLGMALTVDKGFPAFALVVLMAGFFLLAIGAIADQISRWQLSAAGSHSLDLRRTPLAEPDGKH